MAEKERQEQSDLPPCFCCDAPAHLTELKAGIDHGRPVCYSCIGGKCASTYRPHEFASVGEMLSPLSDDPQPEAPRRRSSLRPQPLPAQPRFRVSISTPDITTTIYLNPNIPGDTERLTSPILAALTDLERTALLTQLIGQVVQAHQEWGVA